MKCILDTHFLMWLAIDAPRLAEFPWLESYRPWGVSPISFLEIKYLHEVGKLQVDIDAFTDAISSDDRFVVDEVPLLRLVTTAFPIDWTRDPFDRLLSAHSTARRTPLCTIDRRVRQHHEHIVSELSDNAGAASDSIERR
jgi:PIN domain nuclease of toxin-antitoxin system